MNQLSNQNNSGRNGKIRIAAVGDIHVHETYTAMYKDFFRQVSVEADVCLLCGDLTNLGLPAEAENLAKDLSAADIPVLAVLGNHDHHSDKVEEIKKILQGAGLHFLEEETFTFGRVGFAGVKGFGGGFESHMLGAFGERAMKNFVAEAVNESLKLENSLKNLDDCEHQIIAMHYAPVVDTVRGEPPEIFTYLGSSRLAETIDRFEKVRAVFHGHSHHGQARGKTLKNIPVYNCAVDVLKKLAPPQQFVLFEI